MSPVLSAGRPKKKVTTDRFFVLVVVSRFFCFPIVKNFAERKKWRANPIWRAGHPNTLGGLMRREKQTVRRHEPKCLSSRCRSHPHSCTVSCSTIVCTASEVLRHARVELSLWVALHGRRGIACVTPQVNLAPAMANWGFAVLARQQRCCGLCGLLVADHLPLHRNRV